MLRSIIVVVLGAVLGGVIVAGIESVGQRVYPPPAGLDVNDKEAIQEYIEQAPPQVLLFVLLAWFVGTFCGAAVTARLAKSARIFHALIVGAFMFAAGLMTMLTIPHPGWFWAIAVVEFFPAAIAGALLTSRPNRTSPATAAPTM